MAAEKILSHCLRYDLVQLRGNSCSSTSFKKIKVSSTNLEDKLRFVNSVKRLVFDLTKIPFRKRSTSISLNSLSPQRSEFFYRTELG